MKYFKNKRYTRKKSQRSLLLSEQKNTFRNRLQKQKTNAQNNNLILKTESKLLRRYKKTQSKFFANFAT